MKINPVGAELFHADGWTKRHDEANSRFSQFCEPASKQLRHAVNTIHLTGSMRFPPDRRRECWGTLPKLWKSNAFSWVSDITSQCYSDPYTPCHYQNRLSGAYGT